MILSLMVGCALPRGTKPVVKIGLVAPFEGRYRALGYEVLYAVRLAVRERDAAGGIAGYMVELVALNDDDDPESSAQRAEELAIDPDVVGVVGPFSTAAISAAAPRYHAAGLAMITPATCPPATADKKWAEIFCLGADVDALAQALESRIPPGSRVTLLHTEAGPLGDRLKATARLGNIASWDEVSPPFLFIPPSDVYLYDGDVLSAAELLIAMRAREIESPLWGGPTLARAQLPLIARSAADGTCYAITASTFADRSPGTRFTSGYHSLAGHAPGPWAALAYDAAHLLLDALKRDVKLHGHPSRAGTIAALDQSRDSDGRPIFAAGKRTHPRIEFNCYDTTR